jgi:molybdate transport system substrate-binding protein
VRYVALAFAIAVVLSGEARAEPLKVLTAGAFKQVLLAVIPQFEASGRKVKWETGTVGNII